MEAVKLNTTVDKIIDDRRLDPRCHQQLDRAGILYYGELARYTRGDLIVKGMSARTLRIGRVILEEVDLRYGADLFGWKPPTSPSELTVGEQIALMNRRISSIKWGLPANALAEARRIRFVGELVRLDSLQVHKLRNMGLVRLITIKKVLAEMGLRLGMKTFFWQPPAL